MSEAIYRQVEDAIARRLHLGMPGGSMSLYGLAWEYPVAIEYGNIVMRDSDCGLVKPARHITTDEWAERIEKYGLWKMVGMWDFVPAEDPAAEAIRFCEKHPTAAGRELHELRNAKNP